MSTHSKVGSDDERNAQGVIEIVVPERGPCRLFYTAPGFSVMDPAGFEIRFARPL